MRAFALFLLLVLMGGGGAGWWATRQFDAPGPLSGDANLVVPRGSTADIAESLYEQRAVASQLLFRAFALGTMGEGPLHAGELAFPAAASLREVLAILRTGRPVQHRLTIPEGLTALQVARLVDGAPALTGDTPIPAEGSILPETYSYERGTAREQIIDRARLAMDRALQKAWDSRTPGVPLANKAEALVLASMVERETGKPEERPVIAAVFLNRLRLGMKLQSDPTVIYGVSGGAGVLDHPITRSELEHADPYNTYVVPALPAGPICMPGLAALHAATQPASTTALFFVADGSGGHVFARSQNDHLRNVAHWREVERARALPPVPVQR